jgi:hypothetical protein
MSPYPAESKLVGSSWSPALVRWVLVGALLVGVGGCKPRAPSSRPQPAGGQGTYEGEPTVGRTSLPPPPQLADGQVATVPLGQATGTQQPIPLGQPRSPASKTVNLSIDFGDGRKQDLPALPFKEGMTVLDLLDEASAQPMALKIEKRGSGATAFVDAIDSVRNGGAGHRNWVYFINDQKGPEGAGAAGIMPGDRVLWKYSEVK